MDISARNAAGKCPSGPNSCGERPIWFLAALLLVMFSAAAPAQSAASDRLVVAARSTPSDPVPLPRPRPPVPEEANTAPAAPSEEAGPAASDQPAAPSPCRLALTEAIAIAPSVPAITGPGACGGDDLVRLEAVVLSDKRRVPLKPAATLRCGMATAVAQWIRTDIAALAASQGTAVSELDNFNSFECRGRNRIAGAKLSEHGRANALDVRGIRLANGQSLSLTDRNVSREAREKVMNSVCARFTTVLGPGSDGYHEDHIHLDLAERRNGYRICHWELDGSAPLVATPLPPPRPDEAPPREVASRDDGQEPTQIEDVKVQPVTPPPALSLSPVPMARQPTDVAKPIAPEPGKPETAKSDTAKSDTAKSETAKSGAARPTAKSSPGARRAAREPPTQPMQIAPDATPANNPPSSLRHAKPRKTARTKSRRSEPDLPRVLRKMFE